MTQTVLITGATDGIGRALVQRLAGEGARLVLVGRRPLASLADPLFTPATYCRADLGEPDAAARVDDFLAEAGITALDLVVHCAGVGWHGSPVGEPGERIRTTLDVNLWAPIALTHALLDRLEAARGTLVFVSSVLADLPAADIATYAASKAALDGFARSLRVELGRRVRVVAVHPGGTATRMHEKAGVPEEQRKRFKFPSAAHVAGKILGVARKGRRSPTIGFGNAAARFIGRRIGAPLDWLMIRGRK